MYTPTVFIISPTCIMISSTVLNTPTVLKITPQYSWYAHSSEHPHGTQEIPTFIMISPTVLNTPQYSRYPPTVLMISSMVLKTPTVLNTPTVVCTHYTGWSGTVHCRVRIQSFKICMFCFICVYNGWNIREIHYHMENKTNGGKQIEFSAESNQFEKESKVGINEMFNNC